MKGVSESENILYTVKEVASLLKTNVDYVHKLRKSGLLPFLKLGQYKVRKQALDDFLSRYEGKDLTNPFLVKELNHNGKDYVNGSAKSYLYGKRRRNPDLVSFDRS